MGKVIVKKLKIKTCHGVNDFEKRQPQKFEFSAEVSCDFYEAAKLDGANWWKQTVYITVPSLKNVGIYLLISLVVSSFQLYEIALVIVGAGALHSTEGPIYYLYYQFNYTKNMGEVYAASLIVAIVLTALSSVIFRLTSSEKSMD